MKNEDKALITESAENLKFHSRGYLPHFDVASEPQMLTFRLNDSLPQQVLASLAAELKVFDPLKQNTKRSIRIEELLDRGIGDCHLSKPEIAQITARAIQYHNEQRYLLHAWVIMPNHVHVLLTAHKGNTIASIIHSWKSFTSNRANAILGRQGSFWQREYFDRKIRNEEHFTRAIEYVHNNPLKAGLCETPESWIFSSAYIQK